METERIEGNRELSRTPIAGARLLRRTTVERSTVLGMAIKVDLSQLQKFPRVQNFVGFELIFDGH